MLEPSLSYGITRSGVPPDPHAPAGGLLWGPQV